MAWLILVISGLLETGWAIGLKESQGFTRPVPTILTLIGMVVSMLLLSIAARTLPIGTAYAVWVGIGAVGTAIVGMVYFGEPASAMRLVSLGLLLAGIVGLKLAK